MAFNIYRSSLDPFVLIEDNFCALTVVRKRRHAQIVIESIKKERYVLKIADLNGLLIPNLSNRKNFFESCKIFSATVGQVRGSEFEGKLIIDDRSKTWKIPKDLFKHMWRNIEAEATFPGANRVYFHALGSASIFSKDVLDFKPLERSLFQIKQSAPLLFNKICQKVLERKSKRKFDIGDLCDEKNLWENDFIIINNLLKGKLGSEHCVRIRVIHELFDFVEKMFDANQIITTSMRAHNCITWVIEKLELAGITTASYLPNVIFTNARIFIRMHQLTREEKKERKKIKEVAKKCFATISIRIPPNPLWSQGGFSGVNKVSRVELNIGRREEEKERFIELEDRIDREPQSNSSYYIDLNLDFKVDFQKFDKEHPDPSVTESMDIFEKANRRNERYRDFEKVCWDKMLIEG